MNKIKFELLTSHKNTVYDQMFYFILNVIVMDTFFLGNVLVAAAASIDITTTSLSKQY